MNDAAKELIGKQFPVLDHGKGWIELQDVMGDDLAVVNAARVSFLGESKGDDQDKKLMNYLMKNRHTSPFEQVEIKLRVKAPLVTWWQWVRHRTWNFNAQSGRYTPFEEDEFYRPGEWRKQSASNKQGSDGLIDPTTSMFLTEQLGRFYVKAFKLYEEALYVGVAKEQARLFLPGFSVYYTWIAKTDLHNLMHFIDLRMDSHAQYEIRVYAESIYQNIMRPCFPWITEAFDEHVLKMGDDDGGA